MPEKDEKEEKFRGLTKDELRAYYNLVFSTGEGRIVLSHMFSEMGLFSEKIDSPLRGYAALLLQYVGNDDADVNIERVVDTIVEAGHVSSLNPQKQEE